MPQFSGGPEFDAIMYAYDALLAIAHAAHELVERQHQPDFAADELYRARPSALCLSVSLILSFSHSLSLVLSFLVSSLSSLLSPLPHLPDTCARERESNHAQTHAHSSGRPLFAGHHWRRLSRRVWPRTLPSKRRPRNGLPLRRSEPRRDFDARLCLAPGRQGAVRACGDPLKRKRSPAAD